LCDAFFNTPEFGYDGGDCCEATCVSTEYFSCGNGIIEQSVGAFGYVGFTDCEDPSVSSQISGSQTLFDIVQRGNVRCSSSLEVPEFVQIKDGIPSGFEVDICKAIAGAVLGDPEAIDIHNSTGFTSLVAKTSDVQISRTTYTGERDVYKRNIMVGLSFASLPYFF